MEFLLSAHKHKGHWMQQLAISLRFGRLVFVTLIVIAISACTAVPKEWIQTGPTKDRVTLNKPVLAIDPRSGSRTVIIAPRNSLLKSDSTDRHQQILVSTQSPVDRDKDIFFTTRGLYCVGDNCEPSLLASRHDWKLSHQASGSPIVGITYSRVEDRTAYAADRVGRVWFKRNLKTFEEPWEEQSRIPLEQGEYLQGILTRLTGKYSRCRKSKPGASLQDERCVTEMISFKPSMVGTHDPHGLLEGWDRIWAFSNYSVYRIKNSNSPDEWSKLSFNPTKLARINDLIQITAGLKLHLIVATDKGIYSSDNDGASWRKLDTGTMERNVLRLYQEGSYIHAQTADSSWRVHRALLNN